MTQRKEHKLSRRDAELAKHIGFRNRQEGDLTVKGCSIRFSKLMIDQAELADLTQEPLAGRALFCKRAGSVLDEPLFKTLGTIPVTTHLSGRAFLYSTLGTDEIDLGIVTITNIKLEPSTGGLTAVSGVIQATPVLDSRVAEFIDRMGSNVQLALTYEHEAEQQDLPLGNGEQPPADSGEATQDGADPPRSADPEFEAAAKAQVAAFKRGRKAKASGKGAH